MRDASGAATSGDPATSGPVHYVYDLDGNLIAEIGGTTGQTLREYIWLPQNNLPLALITDVDTSPATYYVVADHLNRPTELFDAIKSQVWQAIYLPYGATHSITGSLNQNLRFPGQFFQIESNLHYNWHRHYDPSLGRYTQGDPLGFVDGPSVYAYARNNPVMYVDPGGLQTRGRPPHRTSLRPRWWKQGLNYSTPRPRPGIGHNQPPISCSSIRPPFTELVGRRGDPLNYPRWPRNPATIIDGRNYSGHAIDRMQDRGVPPSAVEDTIHIKNYKGPGNKFDTSVFSNSPNGIEVIVNGNGTVVSVKTISIK